MTEYKGQMEKQLCRQVKSKHRRHKEQSGDKLKGWKVSQICRAGRQFDSL